MLEDLLLQEGFGKLFAKSISRLTTLNDALPQGAPTSPMLSNAYLFSFDAAMAEHAKSAGVGYTRYADDITISGDERALVIDAIGYAAAMLNERGLALNDKKTRVSSRSGQQKVTGVVVNEKPQPPRKLRRRIRAMFHQADLRPEEYVKKSAELRGYLSYLQSYPVLRDSPELKKYKSVIGKLKNVAQ
jgi:retron-type reverse transcriptase